MLDFAWLVLQMQNKSKVEKIKSSVVLPFHHFSGGANPPATSPPVAKSSEPGYTDVSSSPPEPSSGIEQRCRSLDESRDLQQKHQAPEELEFNDQLKAFDYAEARKNTSFGEVRSERRKDNAVASAINVDSGDKRKSLKQTPGAGGGEEDEGNFQNPRRRQAFPPSGNRSATYH
ncbi:unnamed protein product [Triticum turgidum subsp. durum]|uniref:Uncharacterized protein n=1 Tax=Triticum turgidum subsp. durum TaxID=4567 RepID=A0A9R0UUG8_TRITD|nr:unnamed protein product [Triticum turgidum subsp. durum]